MLRKSLILASMLPIITACATWPSSAQEATPRQAALAGAICTKVVRLHEGQAQWDGCVSDLSQVAVAENRGSRIFAAYQSCTQDGFKRGTAELSTCILDRKNASGADSAAPASIAYVKASDSDPHSYFSASFDLRRHREQYACALMGLEPGTGAFGSCVNNLDSDLFNIGIPNG